MNQTERPDLRQELLEKAVELLRNYSGLEYRRYVGWYPEGLHIKEARGYVNRGLNRTFMSRLRAEAERNIDQRRPFRKFLSQIVEEAANRIGYHRSAPEAFPTNFAYVPIKR